MRRKATIAVVLCCSRLGWCLIDEIAKAGQGLVTVGVDGAFTWDQDVHGLVRDLDLGLTSDVTVVCSWKSE